MSDRPFIAMRALVAVIALGLYTPPAGGQPDEPPYCIFPEQKQIQYRCPHELCHLPIPGIPRPPTVKDPQDTRTVVYLSLDEAIRIALANTEVIRVLGGFSASSTGRTIYDPAIQNTTIDNARARFDPRFNVDNTWGRHESPGALAPDVDTYNLGLGLSDTKITGGTATLGVNASPSRAVGGPPNPTPSSVDLGFTQPLLQGGGVRANMAPIVIARINTERSYFQFKDSIQELVRSIIEGYWGLVFARTEVWARRQQVKQAKFALEFFEAQQEVGRADLSDTAQAAVSLASFRASLITSEANLLNREAAFRNALGLPPVDDRHFVASSPPVREEANPPWESLLTTAETYRPDLIELKLVLEADQQQHLIANNQALPRLDATSLYRWNGLDGTTAHQIGVNFSVPLFLRAERATLRQTQLIIARDKANLRQQLHAVSHTLALNLRNLDQLYAQYEAFTKVREASRVNLDRQLDFFRGGGIQNEQVVFLNVLQAITAWGNAITSESASLTQYNAELANLDRQLGIILQNHGVRFFEERFAAIGPLGRLAECECYPRALRPGNPIERYDDTNRPAEDTFDLNAVLREPDRQGDNGNSPLKLQRQRELEESAKELKELIRRLEAERTEAIERDEELPPTPPPRQLDTNESSRDATSVLRNRSWVWPTRAE